MSVIPRKLTKTSSGCWEFAGRIILTSDISYSLLTLAISTRFSGSRSSNNM
jgi:hypothetical protein